MRKKRMTEAEYFEAKKQLEEFNAKIEELKKQRAPFYNKVRWHEYTEGKLSTKYQTGYAYQRFGKRAKELNEEERKIYQRELQRERRRKKTQ